MKKRVGMILFMSGVTALFVSLISFVHLVTREKVELNQELYLKKSILSAAGVVFVDNEVSTLFEQKVVAEKNFYHVQTEKGKALIVEQSGSGLWGEIRAHVGVFLNTKSLSGISILSQNETPGLGGRIAEQWFAEQFRGKTPPLERVSEGSDDTINQFDAITGATVTSRAVETIVNKAAEKAVSGEGENE